MAYLEEWRQDYALLVAEHLQPAWIDAINAAVLELQEKHPGWYFNPMAQGVRDWVSARAAEFVTNVSQAQILGLRVVIQNAAVLHEMSVDGLSRVVRPMVGLTAQQSAANLRYYNTLIANGMSEKKALEKAIQYGAKQHRYRGYNIARTELAFAYNQGSYEGTKQAQQAGYIGEVAKIWCTAEDERVCPVCGALEGKTIDMDGDYDFGTKLEGRTPTIKRVPPAHPSCRCTVIYEEISPPIHSK